MDHLRWSTTRPSKSVPRYLDPLYYHGIKKNENGGKPHECTICKSAFTTRSSLIKHQRHVHSLNGIRSNTELFMREDGGHFGVRCLICSKSERSPALLVKHFVAAHTYKERVTFNLEWMVEEELLDDQASIRCRLGDLTKVGRHTWKDMKYETMKDLHKGTSWFRILSDEDRVLL